MSSAKLLWFFVWRMALWGLVLGALIVPVYVVGNMALSRKFRDQFESRLYEVGEMLVSEWFSQIGWILQGFEQIGGL